MTTKFEVELLPDAVEFLENLDNKARVKVYYNIKKAQFVNDNELFKKLTSLFGSFVLYITVKHTDFFHFGILLTVKKLWL